MATFEYIDTFEYPIAAVFTLLVDLERRPKWINGILEVRVTPPAPVGLGTTYFEAGKFSGFKSEKTMSVTEFEKNCLFTLETAADASSPFRERYILEPITEKSCRVHFIFEVGNVPKVAEFFMRQQMKKDQPQNAARLKALLAEKNLQD